MSLTNTFSDLCKRFAPDAFAINYTLAKNPELSSHEFETVKTIGAVLEKYGMDVTYEFCNLPTAFKASAVKVDNPKGRLQFYVNMMHSLKQVMHVVTLLVVL